jgi:hypothetical protein
MDLGGLKKPVHLNDPTPLAIQSLKAALNSTRLLDTFLEAGGIPAVVQLLRESNCTVSLVQTVDFIMNLMSHDPEQEISREQAGELGEALHESGIWSHRPFGVAQSEIKVVNVVCVCSSAVFMRPHAFYLFFGSPHAVFVLALNPAG